MTLLRQRAVARIQRRGLSSPDEAAFVVHNTPKKRFFSATIEGASSDEGTLDMLTLDVYGLTPTERKMIDPLGLVTIDAGYEDSDVAPVQPVFVGVIDVVPHAIRTPQGIATRIIAHTSHPLFTDPRVNVDLTGLTIADALIRLFDRVGGTVFVPASAYGVVIDGAYAATRGVLEEAQALVAALSYQTGRPHTLAPVTTEQRDGEVKASLTTYRVTDEGNPEGVPVISLDYSKHVMFDGGPSPRRAQTASASAEGADFTAILEEAATFDYEATTAFDPRITIGIGAEISDPEIEEFGRIPVITERVHTITMGAGLWKTQFGGPYIRKDL